MTKADKNRWEKIKNKGSLHYKTDGIEPIDLYKDGNMLQDFAIGNIIKYAYRNRRTNREQMDLKDIDKITHYTEILRAICLESYGKGEPLGTSTNSPS